MKRMPFLVSILASITIPALAVALDGHPTAGEAPFVSALSADLQARFPTADDAVKAGYLRFTNEDDTGAISYANQQWTSQDPAHPSQLWYDVKGRLLGADYSVLQANSADPPHLWGVDPSRWTKFEAHVHYGLVGPDGTTTYKGTGAKTMSEAVASVEHPTASALVTAGLAKSVSDVRFVFPFPAIWDLQVWAIPNPNGAFAEKNPNVIPAHTPRPTSNMSH